MVNAQEVWNKLNAQGMLDEDGKDWFLLFDIVGFVF